MYIYLDVVLKSFQIKSGQILKTLDEHLIPGYTMMRRADSNSLLDRQVIIKNISFEVKDPTIDQVIC